MCGYYAVAAAVTCLFGEDPSLQLYDETKLREHFELMISSGQVTQFPGITITLAVGESAPTEFTTPKLHCICHRESAVGRKMIQCSSCHYWFHCDICVQMPESPGTMQRTTWLGQCCSLKVWVLLWPQLMLVNTRPSTLVQASTFLLLGCFICPCSSQRLIFWTQRLFRTMTAA